MDSNNASPSLYLSPQPGRMRVAVEMLDSSLVFSDMFSTIDAIAACHKAQMEYVYRFTTLLLWPKSSSNLLMSNLRLSNLQEELSTRKAFSSSLSSHCSSLNTHSRVQERATRAAERELRAGARGAPAAAGDRESLHDARSRSRLERLDECSRSAGKGRQRPAAERERHAREDRSKRRSVRQVTSRAAFSSSSLSEPSRVECTETRN